MTHSFLIDRLYIVDISDIAISSITFLTHKEKLILRRNITSVEDLLSINIEDISKIVGRIFRSAVWNARETVAFAKKSEHLMQGMNIKATRLDEEAYPELLKEINDPPYALFYRGDISILSSETVAVVGTRKICRECAEETISFAHEASENGLVVVSGLANGVDTYAHRGAMLTEKDTGTTVAVLPCGIDSIVPVGNKMLSSNILKTGGCILSEYSPGTPAEYWRYVHRNRIIAGLCDGVVVTQAPPGSGALITVDFALDYNRDVMFHKSCFCEEAKQTDNKVNKMLEMLPKEKYKKQSKRTISRYIAEGAPIIANYCEYSKNLERNCRKVNSSEPTQLEFF